MRKLQLIFILSLFGYCASVAQQKNIPEGVLCSSVKPHIVTDTTRWDTDDPAVWINFKNPGESLIVGTDKNRDGALYAFNLQGKTEKIFRGLEGPNNVDVAYGFPFNGEKIDIAVVTERLKQRIRVFRLPELEPVDQGDLVVFDGDTDRAPMGIAIYKRPKDNAFFAIVGGKSGPEEGYLGQYKLEDNGQGQITMTLVRQFGKFSGKKEIEAIAVDNELGYVYYSDETVGVRKYFADPEAAGAEKELALFATEGFARDHEGVSIYKKSDGIGYILVSDQQANRFWIFPREGTEKSLHDHPPLKIIETETIKSDGNEVTSFPLPGFTSGLFVAMSNGKTFHYYNWEDIAGNNLKNNNFGKEIPVSFVPEGKPLIIPFDAGVKIWDIDCIPDRNENRIEFPHLARFGNHWYSSFREGEIHGNHISGRGRVIRSADGIHWKTVGLFESVTGDVRDPRLSVTTDGQLMLNASIAFIEDVAPYRIVDGQSVRRQSVTWLSSDGENWSDAYACPTGINTWRWDVSWHEGFGYSIGYSGKDSAGTLYRTDDGKTWERLKGNLFPGGYGNEAAFTFGHDGTLYVLLRAGLDARVALGVSKPPYTRDWQWSELNADWDGKEELKPLKSLAVFEKKDMGGPNIITLKDGRLLGAGRSGGEVRANYFLIDPEEMVLTRVAGIMNGSSYPGVAEHDGDLWLTYIGRRSGTGPVYMARIRLPH